MNMMISYQELVRTFPSIEPSFMKAQYKHQFIKKIKWERDGLL